MVACPWGKDGLALHALIHQCGTWGFLQIINPLILWFHYHRHFGRDANTASFRNHERKIARRAASFGQVVAGVANWTS